MTRLLLIRHATTELVGKRLAGRTAGVHLNEEGVAQAQALAKRLHHVRITAVYSSPLERAVQTARPIAQAHQISMVLCEDFTELDFGDWTYCAIDEIRNEKQFQHFNTFRSCTRIPGGEWMLQAQTRMITGLQQLCMKHPGETVVVVSHSDLIKAAVAYYAGIHLDLFQRIEISPASVSIIEVYEETARILLLNDVGGIAF